MAKFHGLIGFADTTDRGYGDYEHSVKERPYTGDILQNYRRWDASDKVIDDLDISNRISILADNYILDNLGAMLYVKLYGVAWKIKSFDLAYPRITLLVGGVYNGPQTESA